MKNEIKRKDVYRYVDNGRTIVSKTGKEQPRSAKAHWDLWKVARESTPNEIVALVMVRKRRIASTKDKLEIKRLRSEIKMLCDAYRIVKRKLSDNVDDSKGDFSVLVDTNLSNKGGISFVMSDYSTTHAYFNENESATILESDGNVLDVRYSFEIDDDDNFDGEPLYSSQKHLYKEWGYHKDL